MYDKLLHVWTPVWGRQIDFFERYTLPSLLWPDNLPLSGMGVVHDLYTRSQDEERLRWIMSRNSPSGFYNLTVAPPGTPDLMIWALRAASAKACQSKARMLVAMPDVIFGNGSIGNLLKYASGKSVSLACAHLRINEEDFVGFYKDSIPTFSNPELVDLAFQFPHQNTEASWLGGQNASHISGLTLTRISDSLVALTHRLPTIYLTHFTGDDVDYFHRSAGMSCWDHDWPSTLLDGRLRFIGSSDLFFAVELTERASHIVPCGVAGEGTYHKGQPHHLLNRHFVCCLRANEEL